MGKLGDDDDDDDDDDDGGGDDNNGGVYVDIMVVNENLNKIK